MPGGRDRILTGRARNLSGRTLRRKMSRRAPPEKIADVDAASKWLLFQMFNLISSVGQ